MIKTDGAIKVVQNADGTFGVKCDLMADTRAEVEAIGTDGSSIEGLDDVTTLLPFCTAFTTDKELGILGSDGVWKF